MTARDNVIGVLLAGGRSSRMGGGDKCLLPLAGRPLLARAVERLRPQVADIVLNANGDPARFAAFGLPVTADPVEGFAGPLAGVLAGMAWAREHRPRARWVATAATDTPFFPEDLVARLLAATDGRHPAIALAESEGRQHPVFGLWPTALADDLAEALRSGTRKVLDWTGRHATVTAAFGPVAVGGATIDPFTNVNRPEELAAAEALLTGAGVASDSPARHGKPPSPDRDQGAVDLSPRGRSDAPPVFGVVGWKKSGKTTLVAGLIAELTARGYRVAAMKHAHHLFEIDHEGRDSHKFRQAGARQVAVGSARRWAVMAELGKDEPEPSFHGLLAHLGPCDLVLVEGWKGGPFPKIEARGPRALTRGALAKDDPNIVAVAADGDSDTGGLPRLDIADVAAIADFIEARLGLARPARP